MQVPFSINSLFLLFHYAIVAPWFLSLIALLVSLTCLQANTCLVSSICTRGINYRGRECGLITCYPDTDLAIAKQLIEAKGIKQLPVIKRGGDLNRERKRKIVAVLRYKSIEESIRFVSSIHSLPDVSYVFPLAVIQHFVWFYVVLIQGKTVLLMGLFLSFF